MKKGNYTKKTSYNKLLQKLFKYNKGGNTLKNALLGFIIGISLNVLCIVIAISSGDILFVYKGVNPLSLIICIVIFFVLSGLEELVFRGLIFEAFQKKFKIPMMSILLSSILFTLFHLANPQLTPLAVFNIFIFGTILGIIVYFWDSIWPAITFHAAWNISQSVIFGLPSSGYTSPIHILDIINQKNSFTYNTGFGIEATLITTLLSLITLVLLIYIGKKKFSKNEKSCS